MIFKKVKYSDCFRIAFQVITASFISDDVYYIPDTDENRKFVELILNDFDGMEREQANQIIEHAFMLEFEEDHHFAFKDIYYFASDGRIWLVEKDEV